MFCRFIFLLLLIPFNIFAQTTLTGIVTDSATTAPIPFANIVLPNGISGTVSGIDGTFSVEWRSVQHSFSVSCLGYETATVEVKPSDRYISVQLVPKRYQLSGVDIFPAENPALLLMEKVYEHRSRNNHDLAVNYKCLIYHKMNFSIDTEHIPRGDSSEFANNHIMLIESVSEKQHIAPGLDSERVISGRTSGLENPLIASLPVMLQSFTVYNNNIRLLGAMLTNPVSRTGLQKYLFILEDTIMDAQGDTIFYVSFRPRKTANIKGVEGSMHIHAATYGVKSVSAQSRDNMYTYSIRETYRQINGRQWFPEEFEGKLEMHRSEQMPVPINAQSRSIVSSVELNPKLNRRDFSAITLVDETGESNQPIERFRHMPLTAKDSSTYLLLDSLFREAKLALILENVTKAMVDGFIPAGPLKLEIDKLFGYNVYEGLKLGAGLWTGDKIMKHLSVGGFYYRSFKSRHNNYGAGANFIISRKSETSMRFQWEKRNMAFGKISFLFNPTDITSFDLSNFLANSMEMSNSLKGSFSTRFLNYFKGTLFYEYADVTPLTACPFFSSGSTQQLPPAAFSLREYGMQLKWANKETFTYIPVFGLASNGTSWPVVRTNISIGSSTGSQQFKYTKMEAQLSKRFISREAFKSSVTITGGNIWGSAPPTRLYSLFGLNSGELSYEMPGWFATMLPNEFAANRFVNAFWRSTFYTRLNSSATFKPEISITTAAGWGNVQGSNLHNIKTYSKGYYETGISFGNLMRAMFFKYGVGVYYRYGPCRLPNLRDNFTFTIMLEYGL